MDIKDVVEPTYPSILLFTISFIGVRLKFRKKNIIFTVGLSCNNLKSTQWYLPKVATIEGMALKDV